MKKIISYISLFFFTFGLFSNSVFAANPVITLIWNSPLDIEVYSIYNDAWATASDIEDWNLTSSITSSWSVNSNLVWTYTISYDVVDSSSNSATQVTRTINVVDTIKPTWTITYSNTWATNQDVIATLSLSESGSVTNNSWLFTKTFTANGSFTFEFQDNVWNTGSVLATVNNIDKTKPTWTITYSNTWATNQDVIATLSLSESGSVTNNSWLFTKTFTANGSFTFEFQDNVWNTGSVLATVNNIDKTKPTIIFVASNAWPTNTNFTVDIEFSESVTWFDTSDITLSSNSIKWSFTTIENNKKYRLVVNPINDGNILISIPSLVATDSVWNKNDAISNYNLSVADLTSPTISITNPNTLPSQTKTLTWSTNEGTLLKSITSSNICNSSITFVSYSDTTFNSEIDNWKYVCFKAIDLAWNITYSISNPISWIDKTSPTVTISTIKSTLKKGEKLTFSILFNEAITWFDLSDITFLNWSGSSLTSSWNLYNFEFTPQDNFEWTWSVLVNSWALTDIALNNNLKSNTLEFSIDTKNPTASVIYSTTLLTNQDVISTLTWSSEQIIITNNSWSTSKTFTENWTFTFEFKDLFWNTGSVLSTVNNIDKIKPIITINGLNPISLYVWDVYSDSWASWSDNVSWTWVLVWTWTLNTWVLWTYNIQYSITDQAWNNSTLNRVINVISKPVVLSGGGWWWGGGGFSVSKDSCPSWDTSWSSYDWRCSKPSVSTNTTTINNDKLFNEVLSSSNKINNTINWNFYYYYKPNFSYKIDSLVTKLILNFDNKAKKLNLDHNSYSNLYANYSKLSVWLKIYIEKDKNYGLKLIKDSIWEINKIIKK